MEYTVPKDVAVEVKDQRFVTVRGIDKQRVGQVAAVIRGFKSPEPYRGRVSVTWANTSARKEGKSGAK